MIFTHTQIRSTCHDWDRSRGDYGRALLCKGHSVLAQDSSPNENWRASYNSILLLASKPTKRPPQKSNFFAYCSASTLRDTVQNIDTYMASTEVAAFAKTSILLIVRHGLWLVLHWCCNEMLMLTLKLNHVVKATILLVTRCWPYNS